MTNLLAIGARRDNFLFSGRRKATAIWNYYEVLCKTCLTAQWVPAGGTPKPCCPSPK
jgi:hypothetical protein